VLGIWTADDLDIAGMRSLPGVDRPCLAAGRVRFVGEGVAVVVAADRQIAADAAALVEVGYRELPAAVTVQQALRDSAPAVLPGFASNVVAEQELAADPVVEQLAAAPHRRRLELRNQRVAPLPMETISCLADWTDSGLTVWATTQAAHRLRNDLCDMLGLRQDFVRVISPDVGGGFGAKACFYPEYLLCCELSRQLGRPVKAVETRSESLLAMAHGRAQHSEIEIGFDDDGLLLAMDITLTQDSGAWPEPVGVGLPTLTAFMSGGCYRIGRIAARYRCVTTHTTPVSAYRGAGRPEATYLIERVVDEVAVALGRLPEDIRRVNLVRPDQMPYATQFAGIVYDESDYPRLLDELLGHLKPDAVRRRARELREQRAEVAVGVGLSTWVEMGGFGPSASLQVFGYLGGWESAQVRMNPDGSVVVLVGTTPHGQGHETTFAQIAADALGIGMDAVTVLHSDSRVVQEGIGTLGSRGMAVCGPAVHRAAGEVRAKLMDVAAELLESSVEDVEQDGETFAVRGAPGSRVDLRAVATAAYDPATVPEGHGIGLQATNVFEPANLSYPSGAHGCEVEVDLRTGLVSVLRYVAVDDCGVIINPLLVRGQIEGGLAQGVGQALMEIVDHDSRGHPLARTLADYAVPNAPDLPAWECHHIEVPTSFNPLGAKGVGEAGTTAAPPAVVNAVLDALRPHGVTAIDMPLTPERVWAALDGARGPAEAITDTEVGT